MKRKPNPKHEKMDKSLLLIKRQERSVNRPTYSEDKCDELNFQVTRYREHTSRVNGAER